MCILLLSHCIVLCSMEARRGGSTAQPWSVWDALSQLRCLMGELLPQVICSRPSGEGAFQLPPAETQLFFGVFKLEYLEEKWHAATLQDSAHEAAESMGKGAEGTQICSVMEQKLGEKKDLPALLLAAAPPLVCFGCSGWSQTRCG